MNIGGVYQEVYELLCNLNYYDLHKIPKHILNDIYEKRDKTFKTKIDKKDIYNRDNISKEAFELYFQIDYNYIMTEEEKKELLN